MTLALVSLLTGGASGLTGIPAYTGYLNTAIVALLLAILLFIPYEAPDMDVLFCRDNEIVAEASGVNTVLQAFCFVFCIPCAGIAGSLCRGLHRR